METIVSIGNQGFDRLREEGSFYIDKNVFYQRMVGIKGCYYFDYQTKAFW